MRKLENRVAVITGGAKGIGKGIAVAFAKEGANIVFSYYHSEKKANATVEELKSFGVKVLAIKADIRSEDDIKHMCDITKQEFGKVNILVNNSGIYLDEKNVVDMPVADWDETINTDLRGVFLMTKYFGKIMDKQPRGKIINISSELSLLGRAGGSHYVAAKCAINGFTKSTALEFAPDILVNAIAPGPVETDMIMTYDDPAWIENEKMQIPLQRFGTVEEIAALALLLASDEGDFFCGQLISPNGGAVLH